MKRAIVSLATFEQMLRGLIESGVNFEAKEIPGNGVNVQIEIKFDGGY